MGVNRKELARRIAYRGGFEIGAIEEVLAHYEDIVVEALENGEDIKHGKLFKLYLYDLPEKRAWNGLDKVHYIRPPSRVPRFKLLSRLDSIRLPAKEKLNKSQDKG